MMQQELIEGMIANKLELSGMKNEGAEGQCRALLHHLFTAVEMYRLMIPQEKQTAAEWFHFFAKDFRVKTRHSDVRAKLDLEERKKAFWNELLEYEGKYGRQMLLKFYYYWAEELENLNMMKWEVEKANKSFNIKYRLGIWSKRSYETDDKAADIHLERVKGKKSAKAAVSISEQQALAAEREAADAQREAATAKAKAESITMEDYLKNNPNSILRTLKKND